MSENGFAPEQIDTSRPHPARMYDYYLGGQDNYEVDRAAAERVITLLPDIRPAARENRDFLHRAVRLVAGRGVRQFVDIGTGIPLAPNTHEVAGAVVPDARVAYVDNDPIVSAYAGAKLTAGGNAGFVLADVREPASVYSHAVVEELIDFDEPVALVLVALLHFLPDHERPREIVAELTSRLAPGSCLVLSHGTPDFHDEEQLRRVAEVYQKSTAPIQLRPHAEVLSFFEGFDLLEPGLAQIAQWRPTGEVPPELRTLGFYGGVGVKR